MSTNEDIVSRRSFFRTSVQIVLPILTLLVLPSCAPAKKLRTAPSTCRGTCTGTCKVSCGSACDGSCAGSCKGLCAVACGGSCAGTCLYMCQHSTKL